MALKDFMAARGEGDEREDAGAARLPAASERRLRSVAPSTCIDSTSELKGTLRCNETLRIDGQVKGEVYRTRDLARADVFEYIEMFYNRTRRHSHLGGVSPEVFEIASNRGL